jgi:hypothetical protein
MGGSEVARANPAHKECERDADIHERARHPHDESPELLILERAQTPVARSLQVGSVPGPCGECYECSQYARMNRRCKK